VALWLEDVNKIDSDAKHLALHTQRPRRRMATGSDAPRSDFFFLVNGGFGPLDESNTCKMLSADAGPRSSLLASGIKSHWLRNSVWCGNALQEKVIIQTGRRKVGGGVFDHEQALQTLRKH
jgi:hypothetical protein